LAKRPLSAWRTSRLPRDAESQRIDSYRLGDVLEALWPEIGHRQIEPPFDLAIGVLRKTDAARLADPFETCGDIDAIAHQVAVALLNNIAEMNADAEFDALVWRDLGIALDHRPLDFDGAVHRVDNAAEFDDAAVARSLDDPAVMHGDGWVDQVAAQRPEPYKDAIPVRARKSGIADDVSDQDRGQFPRLAHGANAEVARSPDRGGLGMVRFHAALRGQGMEARSASPRVSSRSLSTPC
jgi:hypothetical protein